jgi:hypothetical protein
MLLSYCKAASIRSWWCRGMVVADQGGSHRLDGAKCDGSRVNCVGVVLNEPLLQSNMATQTNADSLRRIIGLRFFPD